MTVELLKSFGLTEEQIIDRVVEQIAGSILSRKSYVDPESEEEIHVDSEYRKEIDKRTMAMIKDSVDRIALRNVIPNVETFIENFKLQQTNAWGEKKGEAVTFTQYLIQRADEWINEPVDHSGKSKSEAGGYSWNKAQNRVAYMIDQHLQYHIKTAMQAALSDLNSKVAQGLAATVQAQLKDALERLRVDVKKG